MIRPPSPNWQWRYLPEHDCLALALAPDDVLTTVYKGKQLTIKNDFCQLITLEQTGEYHEFAESLYQAFPDIQEPMLFQMLIHALAAKHFHKSIANKSWLFKAVDEGMLITPLVSFQTDFDEGIALVLEIDNDFATIMLLSEQLQVAESKDFARYSLIKTNVNTLVPVYLS